MTQTTAPAPSPPRPEERDPDLWHACSPDAPERSYCGIVFETDSEPLLDPLGPTCVVCEELAAAYEAGRWEP